MVSMNMSYLEMFNKYYFQLEEMFQLIGTPQGLKKYRVKYKV